MNADQALKSIEPSLNRDDYRYVIDSHREIEGDGVRSHEFVVIYFLTNDLAFQQFCEGRTPEHVDFLESFFRRDGHRMRYRVDDRGIVAKQSLDVS